MCLAWAFVVAVPVNLLVIPVSSGVGLHMIVIVALPTIVIIALASNAAEVNDTVEATIKGLHLLTEDSVFTLQNINFGLLDVESVHKSGCDLKKYMHGDCTLLTVAIGGPQDGSWVIPELNPMGDLDFG